MKIGILTLPFNVNYGGILQAYALQTYLESMGHEVVFINRVYGRPDIVVLFKRLMSVCKCVIRRCFLRETDVLISNPFAARYCIKEDKDLDWTKVLAFPKRYLHISNPLISTHALRCYIRDTDLDCIFVGSDQVWRDCYSPNIYNGFLNFLPRKKKIKCFTYAASFGSPDKAIPWYKLFRCVRLARRFDYISVRETSAVKYMENVFGRSPFCVLDPTLLLPHSVYSKFVRPINFRYLGCYILDMTQEKWDILDYVQRKLKVARKIISTDPDITKSTFAPSVEEWLANLSQSDFVVTDSYHGAIFAIIFRKPFIAISNNLRGNDRFVSLLDSLGLTQCLVSSLEQVKCFMEAYPSDIYDQNVLCKFSEMLEKSKAYINMCLSLQ